MELFGVAIPEWVAKTSVGLVVAAIVFIAIWAVTGYNVLNTVKSIFGSKTSSTIKTTK